MRVGSGAGRSSSQGGVQQQGEEREIERFDIPITWADPCRQYDGLPLPRFMTHRISSSSSSEKKSSSSSSSDTPIGDPCRILPYCTATIIVMLIRSSILNNSRSRDRHPPRPHPPVAPTPTTTAMMTITTIITWKMAVIIIISTTKVNNNNHHNTIQATLER